MLKRTFFSVCLSAICCYTYAQDNTTFILRDVTLIDGSGDDARSHVSLVVANDTVAAIIPAGGNYPSDGITEIDARGKTVMPLMVNDHGHVGLLNGKNVAAANYTPDNVERHLMQYLKYGIGTVLSLGTDQPSAFIFQNASRTEMLGGASFYTAGYGFGVPKGTPPVAFGPSVLRPVNADDAIQKMRHLATLKPDFVKIWVDGEPRMLPEIYRSIIEEAHAHNIKVAAHVYYLEDARGLVDAGVDVLAHSVRDQEVDDALIAEMKRKHVSYIPTLSIEEYGFIYATRPAWFNEPFFIRALEQGVWEMLDSEEYRKQFNSQEQERKKRSLMIASRNLHKMDSAGITIVMGTDSGAQPVRAIGFSEHLELQLMVEAGIPPLRAISYATKNGAAMLGIDARTGTLMPGKKADFMVLDGNPLQDIKATRGINAIYKNGKKIQ